ncbi:MAG: class I SAM-dependent methyltransferase [Patescibacteria group bacterium]|jgi:tRNA A58 N-methylase Trm61
MVDAILPILILLGIIVFFGTAAYAGLKAAPWVPVFKRDIPRIIKLAGIKPDDIVYDLGCGDGRVLVALANSTPAKRLVGFEISVLPYLWTKGRIIFRGLSRRVDVVFKDFLKRDLSQASVIFCFLTPMAMKKLAPKFKAELRPGSRIISYSFSIPGFTPDAVDKPEPNQMTIYSYRVDTPS